MSAQLLGTLEKVVNGALRTINTYKKRTSDGSTRTFGGVNVIMCADFWQLHPVSGTFLATNPLDVGDGCAQTALLMFWEDSLNSIRSLWELTQKGRCDDDWYNDFLGECRVGNLSKENYCYIHGLNTLTSPGTAKCRCNDEVVKDPVIGTYRKRWAARFLAGDLPEGECRQCRAERAKRHSGDQHRRAAEPPLHRRTNPIH